MKMSGAWDRLQLTARRETMPAAELPQCLQKLTITLMNLRFLSASHTERNNLMSAAVSDSAKTPLRISSVNNLSPVRKASTT